MVLGHTSKQKGGKFCYFAQIVIDHHRRPKESIRSVCKRLAPKLGICHQYLYQVAYGYNSPGPKTAAKIEQMYRKIKAKKKKRLPPSTRIVTTFPDLELGKEIAAELTMDERREALKKALKEKWSNQELPPFMGKRERYKPPPQN